MKKGTKTYVVTALVAASSFFGTAYAVQVDHTNTVVVPGSACSPSNGPGSASSDESTEYYRSTGAIVNMSATKWLSCDLPIYDIHSDQQRHLLSGETQSLGYR